MVRLTLARKLAAIGSVPIFAAAGALWAGIQNAGQSCGGVERIYVHEAVYEEFLRLLKER
jgi:acyl-CoA reductase-like NAD-dependent aldehyde dehydrogenase